jgi:hypothetical protein
MPPLVLVVVVVVVVAIDAAQMPDVGNADANKEMKTCDPPCRPMKPSETTPLQTHGRGRRAGLASRPECAYHAA